MPFAGFRFGERLGPRQRQRCVRRFQPVEIGLVDQPNMLTFSLRI